MVKASRLVDESALKTARLRFHLLVWGALEDISHASEDGIHLQVIIHYTRVYMPSQSNVKCICVEHRCQ